MGEPAPVINFASAEDEDRYHRSRARRGRGEAPTRELPHSLEAEEYLLSACLLDGGATVAKAYAAGVREGSFYEPKHGTIWRALEKLWHEQRPVEIGLAAEEIKARGELERVGGWAFLLKVSERLPTTAQAPEWIRRAVEFAERRAIIREAEAAREAAFDTRAELTADDRLLGSLDRLQGMRVRSQRDLPPVMRDDELEAADLPEAPQLIEGVLHRGRRTLLLAPSKASKTWTCMHMSIAIASGKPWLGFRTHAAPVLHIDLELPTWDLKKRRNKLREMLGVQGKLDVDWWSLDGYQRSIDELTPLITARAPMGKFGLIAIEPAYVILGKRDENDNADITDFMNRLAWIARLTGAAVLCTHHFAKGDASKKAAQDRGSGAGTWVRAPDTAITLTPLAESEGEDCYSMEFIERSMKRHPAMGVKFEYPLFRLQSGLNLTALREAGRPKETTEADVVKLLGDDMLTHAQWLRVAEQRGMSERTFNRRLKEAVDKGLVIQNGATYRVASASS